MSSPADTRFREADYLAAVNIAADQLYAEAEQDVTDALDLAASNLASRFRRHHALDLAASNLASRFRRHHEDVLLDLQEAMLR